MTTTKQKTAFLWLVLSTIMMTSSFAKKEDQTVTNLIINKVTNKVALSDKQVEEQAAEEELPDADFLEFLAGMDDASDDEFNAWLKTPKAADKSVNKSQIEKNN